MEQLELFRQHLPKKPYCTNQLGSLIIRNAKTAQSMRYIQHNQKNEKMWLVYDIDRAIHPLDIENELLLPPPNLFIQNPKNEHAHIAYSLFVPIHVNANSSQKVLRFAAAIDCAYQDRLKADKGYSGLIMKNPLHKHWITIQQYPQSYDLGDLACYVNLRKYNDRRKRNLNYGLGRNCTMFEKLRMWAYRNIKNYRPHRELEWFNAVFDKCEWINTQFESPLPFCEVKATSKSVSKWVWRYYEPKVNRGRDAIQNYSLDLTDKRILSAKNTNKARINTTQAKIMDAVKVLHEQGKKTTQKAISEVSGLSTRTIRKYKNLMPKKAEVRCTSDSSPLGQKKNSKK